MAALANPFLDLAREPDRPTPRDALARLAAVHADATETARLANLLGRSLHVAIALPVLAAAIILFSAGALAPALAWAVLVGIGTLAVLARYARTVEQPFERAPLDAFARDLDAALLYAGFAFGAGAFLVLPADVSGSAALAFALVPSVTVAMLLRARRPALLFLAPVAALSSLACAIRPFGDGMPAAVLLLAACGVLAGAMHRLMRTDRPIPLGMTNAQ